MSRFRLVFVICFAVLCANLGGCGDVGSGGADLSRTPKYSSTIGTYYRTTRQLYAHGLYSADGSRRVDKLWVSPYAGTGPEVAFNRGIPVGRTLKVVAVRKAPMPFENGLHFVVTADNLDLPSGLEIIIPLYAEFHDNDGFPDRNFFEKVPTR